MEGIIELSMEITYCSFDHRPIEDSPAYRALLLCGEEVANLFTYTETVPIISRHPPPAGDTHERTHMVG